MKRKFFMLVIFVIITILLFIGCADVTQIEACVVDTPCGFWSGLWHGFISPISFIGSLFDDDIALYAVNNNGEWYDFGFIIGSGILSRLIPKS